MPLLWGGSGAEPWQESKEGIKNTEAFASVFLRPGRDKKDRKNEAEAPKIKKYALTKKNGCDKMVIHTVVVCPSVAIRSNMVILPQMEADVKHQVVQK